MDDCKPITCCCNIFSVVVVLQKLVTHKTICLKAFTHLPPGTESKNKPNTESNKYGNNKNTKSNDIVCYDLIIAYCDCWVRQKSLAEGEPKKERKNMRLRWIAELSLCLKSFVCANVKPLLFSYEKSICSPLRKTNGPQCVDKFFFNGKFK